MRWQSLRRLGFPVLAVAVAAGLTGCAKRPENIAPAYVSHQPYVSWSCQELGEEALRLNGAFSAACEAQRDARSADIAGVILIGLPVASLSGDNIAPQIATLKGNIRAVQEAMRLNNCTRFEPGIPDSHSGVQAAAPPQP